MTTGAVRMNYEETSNGQKKVNMNKLFSDLYIPIGVKYNFLTNEYAWFIMAYKRKNICPDTNGDIRLSLYEPRINNV